MSMPTTSPSSSTRSSGQAVADFVVYGAQITPGKGGFAGAAAITFVERFRADLVDVSLDQLIERLQRNAGFNVFFEDGKAFRHEPPGGSQLGDLFGFLVS